MARVRRTSPDRRWMAATCIGSVLIVAACAEERSLDPDRLEQFVESAVADGLGIEPTAVDCPPVTGIENGTTFRCEVTLDGQILGMEGEVVDAVDGSVEVANVEAVLLVDLLEWVIADDVSQQLGEWIDVECADGEVIVAAVGSQLICTAVDAAGNEATVTVEVDDAEGNVSYELR